MNLVIDANILFAALIRDNVTRMLLVNEDIRLYAPEFIFVEIEKYSSEICVKSGKSIEELKKVLDVLADRITIITAKELIPHIAHAERITPDPKDVPYVALCLCMNCALWSNDAALKGIGIKVISTSSVNLAENS